MTITRYKTSLFPKYFPARQFLALCILILLPALGCGGGEDKIPETIRPVRYQEVLSSGGGKLRTFTGVAKAGVESNLSFKVSGTVLDLPVKLGDKVAEGTLIAEIDPSDYLIQKQEAEASLISSQAQARNAQSDYSRIRALYENNNASRGELDNVRASSESADAQVDASKKRLELADLQLSYTKLTSPVDGAIAEVYVEVNENVSTGEKIVTITSGSNTEVHVAVPEILISSIQDGSPVDIKFDAIPGKMYTGTVVEVGVSSTSVATTFPVTVRVNSENGNILPGMAAEVVFRFESQGGKNKIIVPSVSVGEDREGRFVYVLEMDADNKGNSPNVIARKKAVTVGDISAEGIEIVEGLKGGELIVTAGVRRIIDGQKVKLLEAPDTAQ